MIISSIANTIECRWDIGKMSCFSTELFYLINYYYIIFYTNRVDKYISMLLKCPKYPNETEILF